MDGKYLWEKISKSTTQNLVYAEVGKNSKTVAKRKCLLLLHLTQKIY